MKIIMKDSGIEWIGQIPKDWGMQKIKHWADLSTQNSFVDGDWIESPDVSDNGIRYLTTGNIGDGVFKRQGNGYVTVDTFKRLNCKYAYPKDLVISRLNAPYGRSCILPNDFTEYVLAVDNVILRTKESANYICYATQCDGYHKAVEDEAKGTTMKRISRTNLGNILIPHPPLSEQQKIADYLDKVCGEADEMIVLQEKMIEELKAYKQSVITEAVTKGLNPNVPMKDSGIDWIGEIPEHWNVCRIKNVATLFGRIGFRGYTSDDLNKEGEGAITLSPSNMKPMGMDFSSVTYLSWKKYEESPEIMIHKNDLLMVKTGSSYGKVSYVDNLPKESTINPQILRIIPSIHSKYLGYYMQTSLFLYQVEGGVVGGTIPTISQEKINNFFVILPNAEERHSIASYLDAKCSDIDSLIALKKAKIEELKEYKKSVIYEYVTGKKEVL